MAQQVAKQIQAVRPVSQDLIAEKALIPLEWKQMTMER